MSILWERLPTEIDIGSNSYSINTNFKTMLKFDALMSDNELENEIKVYTALKMFYKDIDFINDISLVEQAYHGILWFYSCGEYEKQETEITDEEKTITKKKVFSFEHDAKYILAAFRQVYNIDLINSNLHWWEFKDLFDGLPSNTELVKIIGYRSMTISSDMSDKEKQRIRKLKKMYALPDERTEEEKEKDFAEALFG